jgi:hypothetical protein
MRLGKQNAIKGGFSLYCIHSSSDGTYEYAAATPLRGQKGGQTALASAIVSARPATWVALFDLPNGQYYVVASRNGAIDPQSDALFDSLHDATERINEIDPDSSTQLYANPAHGFPGATEWPLEKAAHDGKPTARLRAVDPSIAIKAWAFRIVAAAGICGVAWYAYVWSTTEKPPGKPPEKVQIPPPPWANKESGVEQAAWCIRGLPFLPIRAPGWKRVSVACAGGALAGVYTRVSDLEKGGAPIDWFLHTIVKAGWPASGIIVKDAKTIAYSLPLPVADTIWPANLNPPKTTDVMQRIERDLNSLFRSATVSKPDGKYFQTQTITLKTVEAPRDILKVFERFKGLTLVKMAIVDGKGYETTFSVGQRMPLPTDKDLQFLPPPPVRTLNARESRFWILRAGILPKNFKVTGADAAADKTPDRPAEINASEPEAPQAEQTPAQRPANADAQSEPAPQPAAADNAGEPK